MTHVVHDAVSEQELQSKLGRLILSAWTWAKGKYPSVWHPNDDSADSRLLRWLISGLAIVRNGFSSRTAEQNARLVVRMLSVAADDSSIRTEIANHDSDRMLRNLLKEIEQTAKLMLHPSDPEEEDPKISDK